MIVVFFKTFVNMFSMSDYIFALVPCLQEVATFYYTQPLVQLHLVKSCTLTLEKDFVFVAKVCGKTFSFVGESGGDKFILLANNLNPMGGQC